MLALGNSFEVSHVLGLLFVCCTAYISIKYFRWVDKAVFI